MQSVHFTLSCHEFLCNAIISEDDHDVMEHIIK